MPYKPEQFAELTPRLTVQDAEKALDFYEKAFGFKALDILRDEQDKLQFAALKLGESTILIVPEGGTFGGEAKAPKTLGSESPVSLYVYVPNVDTFYEGALRAGAEEILAPHDAFWGDRFCKVADPDGHLWGFATHKG